MQSLLLNDLKEVPAVVATWRGPFDFGRRPDIKPFKPGMSVAEIVRSFPGLPKDFMQRGTVSINGHELHRDRWHAIRPKVFSASSPHVLHFSIAPRGGGQSGAGKQIIGIVALLALTLATAGIAGGLLGPAGALSISSTYFAAGSISAKILAAGVGLLGALAIAALTRPPTTKPKNDNTEAEEAASATGNVLEPNGAIPRVIGTRKVYPPLACEPRVELVGSDEFVDAVYVLNGAHALSEIKVGEASIDDDDSTEYVVREGWDWDEPQSLVSKVGRTTSANAELKAHKLASGSDYNLANQSDPDSSIPKFHRFAAMSDPDRVDIHFLWPGNVIYSEDPTITLAMPVRIRMREIGTEDWINLPELHMQGGLKPSQIRAQVVIHWDYDGEVASDLAGGGGGNWWFAHTQVPAQSASPADPTYQWEAHSHFYSGSGNRYSTSASAGGVQNIGFSSNATGSPSASGSTPTGPWGDPDGDLKNSVHVYLDSGTFPRGRYEFDVIRGSAYRVGNFTQSSYAYSATVRNFFRYYDAGGGAYRVAQTQRSVSDNVVLTRIVSVWNDDPLPLPGFAAIYVRAKNKAVQQVSCTASGYVRDWDGVGWNDWTITDNPSPHFVDTLIGSLNRDPILLEDLDDDELVEWRARCITNGWRCNAIIEDMRNDDARDLIAGCGRARSYQSEVWGVVQDYDRSAEMPVNTFSARNARSFSFEKAFAELPDGLLATFVDEDNYYNRGQVVIPRVGDVLSPDAKVEQVTYEGLVTEAEVLDRATFDLRQGQYRSTFYYMEVPPEHITCRRGSLVAVQHDVLQRWAGTARIKSVNVVSSEIISIVLDAEIEIKNADGMESATDMLAVTDVLDLGIVTGCSIRRADGTISTHELTNGPGFTDTLVFATPVYNSTVLAGPFDSGAVPAITEECLVVVGPLGSEYLRMIVYDISPGEDLTARMTLVDEAPELWD